MKQLLITLFLSICFPLNLYCSDNAGAFIEKGIQAKASAMGMSQVSIAQNSDAVYWNPALISFSKNQEIRLMGTKAYETQYLSAQGLFRILGHPFGIALINAYIDGIQETRASSTPGRYTFSGNNLDYGAYAAYFSSSLQVIEKLSIGTSVKWIQEKAAGYKATGVGVDIGIAYLPFKNVSFGANIQNLIKPSMRWNTPSNNIDTIPTNIKVGGSVKFLDDMLLTSFDLNFRNNRKIKPNIGLEYWLSNHLPIRIGFDHDELSLGLGLHLESIVIDFSWKNPSLAYIDDVYKISFGYGFL